MLEASTSAGSVALFVEGALLAERSVLMGPSRDDALLPAIAEVLAEAAMRGRDVRNIACGNGPGSFTSLRIAASLAKGLTVANDASLFAIPSLLIAAAGIPNLNGEYVLHSDALRGERYVLAVGTNTKGNIASCGVTTRMNVDTLATFVAQRAATSVAIGSTTPGDADVLAIVPHARNVDQLQLLWHTFGPVGAAEWEPEYGRLAEAQVKWETVHGHALPAS